ncbi:MAG TPA: response regulator [Thermomicrobiales bacterium]|nr:response regulator [Thermomicrobiales bacterium]
MSILDGAQPHILAINHSPEVLTLLEELLREEGYRVTTRSHLDRDLRDFSTVSPDLIVIDYMWATDDDNWSLLQLLRMNPATRDIPIVLCTGAVREAQALESHLFEMRIRVVYKPFDIGVLLGVIADALMMRDSIPGDG